MKTKPIITLDLDGVICDPPFGVNLGIGADFLDPAAPSQPAHVPPRWWSSWFDRVRFDLRRPIPGVAEALRTLHEVRAVYLLTGRRTSPEAWLRRHHLDRHIDRIITNETRLRSPHFKLAALAGIRAAEHVDDDGRTAQLIARRSQTQVYLIDWPRNRGPKYDEHVTRVASLGAVPPLLH